ncbi:MAG: cytidine deaminase [bacterium]|nr:cytidine deaminase [bacterium]
MTNEELINKAKSVAITKQVAEETVVGEVGAALITDRGNVYTGVSIHAPSGLGFCGEASAIAAMVTNGENRIKTIVGTDGQGNIYSPCGRCREMIRQVNKQNMDTDVILSGKVMKLRDLLPEPY